MEFPFDRSTDMPTQVQGSTKTECFPRQDWENTTDPENRGITWMIPQSYPRVVYLVEDTGSSYKPYIDRFFIFTKPEAAIEKVRELCAADPQVANAYGGEKLAALEPSMLIPGTRYLFRANQESYIEVFIIAVLLTGDK